MKSLMRIKDQKRSEKENLLVKNQNGEDRITFGSSRAWKPLSILLIIFFLQQFTGAYIVIFYAIQIFEKSGSLEFDQLKCLIVLGIIRFVMAIVSMFLSKKVGRKPLLGTSSLGMGIVILIAAGYIHFLGQGLVPIVCLLIFVLFASYGMTTIPWTLIGELLPLSVRGVYSGVSVAVAYLLMFITVKLFLMVLHAIGIVVIFLSFSAVCFSFVFFVYFFVPETFGKTFTEIEKAFK